MSAQSQADAPAVNEPEVPIVDAEVVPEHDAIPPAPPVSLELVRRERRSEVLRPHDAQQLVDSFTAYQELLPQLLEDTDWQGTGSDRFVKKSGWRKIATAFDLDVDLVRVNIERDENGNPIRAEVWARAMAPSGRAMVADGYCSVSEPRFAQAKGRQKLENDLPATAATRAKNRAISDLVGMGAVSAEEVDAGANTSGPAGAGAELAGWAERGASPAKQAFGRVFGPHAGHIWTTVIAQHGYMPKAVADTLLVAADAYDHEEAQAV